MSTAIQGSLSVVKKRRGDSTDRATVRRAIPQYVDTGMLLRRGHVRYHPVLELYDVRDVFQLAFGNDRAYRTTCSKLGDALGCLTPTEKIKWSDESSNSGRPRKAATARQCKAILIASTACLPRAPFDVDGVIEWFDARIDSMWPPQCLPEGHYSSYAQMNAREPR